MTYTHYNFIYMEENNINKMHKAKILMLGLWQLVNIDPYYDQKIS